MILTPHTYAVVDLGNKQITLFGTYLRFIKVPVVVLFAEATESKHLKDMTA
jgi:hypothetical protein